MKLLIIGGTRFLGRHLVTAALERGAEVTLFNRGNHEGTTSTKIETIHGDRNSDLAKLQGRRWDAVVDTCGLLPRTVRASAEILSHSVGRYVFISSVSAYTDVSVSGIDETAPLKTLTSEQLVEANAVDPSGQAATDRYGQMYGGLKALCEQVVAAANPNRTLIIRPGLIVGPHDYSDRFTYWLARVARGGEVLAPGLPGSFVQIIDVRDLAEWTVRMLEGEAIGTYNATGLPKTLTMENLLAEARSVSQSNAFFTWVSEEFLMEEQVAAWSELPLWLPEESAPHLKGFMFINCDKALGAGLSFRALDKTVYDTMKWYVKFRRNGELSAGLEPKKEELLLRKWHQK